MDLVFLETKLEASDDGSIEGMAWPHSQGDRVGDWIQKGAFTGTSAAAASFTAEQALRAGKSLPLQ